MAIVVTNNDSITRVWVGQEISAGGSYILDTSEISRWANDSVVLASVSNSTLTINDGNGNVIASQVKYLDSSNNGLSISGSKKYGNINLTAGDGVTISNNDMGSYIFSLDTSFEFIEDFVLSSSAPRSSEYSFTSSVASGGAGTIPDNTAIQNDFVGMVTVATGTTNNAIGRASINGWDAIGKFKVGSFRTIFENRVRVPVLSGTPSFTLISGFVGTVGTGLPANGIFFYYTNTANSGQWQCVCRASSTSSNNDSSIAVNAGQWYKLRADINAAGNSVLFYIDGVQIGSDVTLNIPIAAMFPSMTIEKTSSATTSRTANWDYSYWKIYR